MKIAGVVAEFNPLHNGHALLMKKVRETGFSHIVVVMSGNYTQRGEAACLLKSARCRAALLCGADLVIELPLPFAVSSAENFAKGAVSIFNSIGCIDSLCFGSESGDIDKLNGCAKRILEINRSPLLSEKLKLGYSFPAARALAAGEEFSDILRNPNDTLAVEYIKSLVTLKSTVIPFTIKREGARHDETELGRTSASASAIRNLFSSGHFDEAFAFIPNSAAEIFRTEISSQRGPFDTKKAELSILSKIRSMSASEFSLIPDVTEGLENRIFSAAQSSCSLEELYSKIKSKRYTMSRIRRIILCAYLGVDRTFTASLPPYIRVLGFNERGIEILRAAKNSAVLPIFMRHADFADADDFSRKLYALECLSTDLYALCLPKPLPCGMEQKLSAIRAQLKI